MRRLQVQPSPSTALTSPPLKTATEAAVRRAGLSFHDHLCLLLARDNGWTCVTNDGRLRRECAAEKVPVLWGLETVALLVDAGVLTAKAAEEIGRAIQRANLRFITDQVIKNFLGRIGAVGKGSLHRRAAVRLGLSRRSGGAFVARSPAAPTPSPACPAAAP